MIKRDNWLNVHIRLNKIEVHRSKRGPGWRIYPLTQSSLSRVLYLAKKHDIRPFIHEYRFTDEGSNPKHTFDIYLGICDSL